MFAIQDFLSSFGNSIISAFNLIIGLIKDFFSFLKIIGVIPEIIINCFNWLPVELVGAIPILVSVVIMYKILGREG